MGQIKNIKLHIVTDIKCIISATTTCLESCFPVRPRHWSQPVQRVCDVLLLQDHQYGCCATTTATRLHWCTLKTEVRLDHWSVQFVLYHRLRGCWTIMRTKVKSRCLLKMSVQ